MKHSARPVVFASLAVLSGAASAAQADVKMVSTISVTGQPPRMGEPEMRGPAVPRIVTAYYQENNSRTETAGGPVVLYNGASGVTTVLDPVRKTYFVTAGQTGGQDRPGGRWSGRMTMQGRVDLKPVSGTQTLVGSVARKFALSGVLKTSFSGSPAGELAGGFSGGGPGGGRVRHGAPQMPQVTVAGDMWLSDTVTLPSSDKQALLPLLREIMPGGGPLLLPVAGSVVKTHELPLLAKITLTLTPLSALPAGQGSQEDAAFPPAPTPTVTTLTVTSVSTAALDASLFAVPQDYAQAAPPRPFGGHGRRPGMFPDSPGPDGAACPAARLRPTTAKTGQGHCRLCSAPCRTQEPEQRLLRPLCFRSAHRQSWNPLKFTGLPADYNSIPCCAVQHGRPQPPGGTY